VVTAHKGDVWLRLVTHGKAAHGSCPHLGKNAVHEMSRIVDLLQTQYARQLQGRSHPLLGTATVSIGSMHGGSQPNIVPAECIATADRRTLPGETELSVMREIKALLREHGLRASFVSEKSASCPPLETDHRLPLVQAFLAAAGQKAPVGATYFCDAAILAEPGMASVVFGPGDIAQAHTAEEWVSTPSLAQATQVLLKFFHSLSS
jgi:acetylornithine deacetylase